MKSIIKYFSELTFEGQYRNMVLLFITFVIAIIFFIFFSKIINRNKK